MGVAANKKLVFYYRLKNGTIPLLELEELITRALGRRRLDEGEADEDAVAATGAGGGGVRLRLVPPGLGATRHARTGRQRKDQGKSPRGGGHGSIWLPLGLRLPAQSARG